MESRILDVAKRMGRPPKPRGEHQDHRVEVLLRAADYDALAVRAQAEDKSPAAWARDMLLRALRRRVSK